MARQRVRAADGGRQAGALLLCGDLTDYGLADAKGFCGGYGRTVNGTPVYNVAMPLLKRCFAERPPFRPIDVPRTAA